MEDLIVKYKVDDETKKILLKEGELLTEFDWEVVLLALGFIPVIGEVFDVILIVKYFKERRWLEAFLMMIALIPTVGDIAVKPFLFAGRAVKAFSSTAKFEKFVKIPKYGKAFKGFSKYFESPQIAKLSTQIVKKNPKLAADIKKAKSYHKGVVKKLDAGQYRMTRTGAMKGGPAKTLIRRKPKKGLGFATTQHFRSKALGKYVAKHKKLPPNGLSSWYNVVYKGRTARRAAFRKGLLVSGVLGALGLPNIESFQDFIATPEGAETAMNNEEFQEFYGQYTTPQDEELIQQQLNKQETGEDEGSLFSGDLLSIPLLKQMAPLIVP